MPERKPLGAGMLLFALFAASCSGLVQDRVTAGLVEAGLSPKRSACMAEIWAERLSLSQIRGISAVAEDLSRAARPIKVGALVQGVRGMNDPEAIAVVASSALRCSV